MAESLRSRSTSALIWAFAQQGGSQLIRILFSILLARQLSPGDYGLAGLAMLVYNFLQILSRFGLGEGLIQAGKLSLRLQSSLLLLHAGLSLLGAVLCWLSADQVALWYGEAELAPLIRLISLSFLFSIGVVIPRSRLEKELRFDALTRRALPASLAAGLLALWAAHTGWGAASLVILLLAEQLILALSLVSWLPFARPAAISGLKDIVGYGWKLSLAGLIGFVGKNIDTALIGKWIGKTELGLYQLGFRLTRLPAQNLAGVLDRVLFPAFSSIRDDKPRIAAAYGKALRALSLIVIPLFTWALFAVKPVIPVLLGESWLDAIPVMQVFCLLAMVQTMGRSMNSVIQSLGRSDLVLGWVFLSAPANILAVWLSASHGILAVAWALLGTRLLIHVFQQLVVTRLLGRPAFALLLEECRGIPAALLVALLHLLIGWLTGFSAGGQLLAGVMIATVLALLLAKVGPRACWRWISNQPQV